jgi:hypothetical protein
MVTPLYHVINHACFSLKPLLKYPLPYIALDNIIVLQNYFNFLSYKRMFHIDMF